LAGTAMAASGPESIPAGPVCAAAAAEPPALAFLELPDGQANPEPLYMVCNPTCTAACNAAFNSCMADCSPTYPGDPCATGCRNAKIICYQGCC
jgi:hypothetical protein